MPDPAYKALTEREVEVGKAYSAGASRYQAQLEKTIIIATKAIIEAIWKARY
jgi:hypothetical protein